MRREKRLCACEGESKFFDRLWQLPCFNHSLLACEPSRARYLAPCLSSQKHINKIEIDFFALSPFFNHFDFHLRLEQPPISINYSDNKLPVPLAQRSTRSSGLTQARRLEFFIFRLSKCKPPTSPATQLTFKYLNSSTATLIALDRTMGDDGRGVKYGLVRHLEVGERIRVIVAS